jgi:hypothetical protein
LIFIDTISIKTTTSKTTTIFSQNSVVELKLIDTISDEVYNKIYLYPHIFVKFKPALNRLVKNADILKLKQFISTYYF